MNLSDLSNDQVHAVAAHLAVAEAVIQTRLAAEIVPEERRYRLRLAGKWAGGQQTGGKLAQVFSRRSGDWQLTDARHPLADDTELVVLVDFIPDAPKFYVIPADWFREDVKQRHDAFLANVADRRRNPDSHHHNVRTPDVEQWHGRWEAARLATG